MMSLLKLVQKFIKSDPYADAHLKASALICCYGIERTDESVNSLKLPILTVRWLEVVSGRAHFLDSRYILC